MSTHDTLPSSRCSRSPISQTDLCGLLQWTKNRDDAARAEREEQKRENAARFEALLTKLANPATFPSYPHKELTTGDMQGSGTPIVVSSNVSAIPSTPKEEVQPPSHQMSPSRTLESGILTGVHDQ